MIPWKRVFQNDHSHFRGRPSIRNWIFPAVDHNWIYRNRVVARFFAPTTATTLRPLSGWMMPNAQRNFWLVFSPSLFCVWLSGCTSTTKESPRFAVVPSPATGSCRKPKARFRDSFMVCLTTTTVISGCVWKWLNRKKGGVSTWNLAKRVRLGKVRRRCRRDRSDFRRCCERGQPDVGDARQWITGYLNEHRAKIIAWAAAESRLQGPEQDGALRQKVAEEVESLSGQVQKIGYERRSESAQWFAEIESVWDDVETRVSELSSRDNLRLERPFQLRWSPQWMIDRALPWFDLVVGGLLIVGLFSRLAALAGIGLLLGVVATQPFWIPGTENTFYQWVEIGALLVLFATAAGRFGGLDYFLFRPSAAGTDEVNREFDTWTTWSGTRQLLLCCFRNGSDGPSWFFESYPGGWSGGRWTGCHVLWLPETAAAGSNRHYRYRRWRQCTDRRTESRLRAGDGHLWYSTFQHLAGVQRRLGYAQYDCCPTRFDVGLRLENGRRSSPLRPCGSGLPGAVARPVDWRSDHCPAPSFARQSNHGLYAALAASAAPAATLHLLHQRARARMVFNIVARALWVKDPKC